MHGNRQEAAGGLPWVADGWGRARNLAAGESLGGRACGDVQVVAGGGAAGAERVGGLERAGGGDAGGVVGGVSLRVWK
ncbi:uncharacterized protein H6S33_004154 [Morchella sextelata]|uniref:uncharacterized protein n=1 Tax=Morchella sextelata TaxID=1174677 RepID=UPI001D041811|nr:uncharacterized protein H6S33_004154 [Morchella sextelata]KAH0605697.1 hypothetical protein H6S33_004154 [Morchella sextelata]